MNCCKKTKIPIYLLIIILTAGGCGMHKASQKQIDARIALFKECLELAAKMPRLVDDVDVAVVVDSCSSQAYYMTNQIDD